MRELCPEKVGSFSMFVFAGAIAGFSAVSRLALSEAGDAVGRTGGLLGRWLGLLTGRGEIAGDRVGKTRRGEGVGLGAGDGPAALMEEKVATATISREVATKRRAKMFLLDFMEFGQRFGCLGCS